MPKLELDNLMEELQVAREDRPEFLSLLDKVARSLTSSPAKELKWRLNEGLQGRDPGRPINWPGL
jgi:hypothetical protein